MRFVFDRPGGGFNGMHILGVFGLLAVLLARFFPFERLPIGLCSFKSMTGIPCPTCGMTTCFIQLTHGQFAAALRSSPLGVVVFGLAVMAAGYLIANRVLGWRAIRLELDRRDRIMLAVGAGLAILANWLYMLQTTG